MQRENWFSNSHMAPAYVSFTYIPTSLQNDITTGYEDVYKVYLED